MKHFAGYVTRPIRKPLARERQTGFALIEALVSTVIFSIGLLGLIGLAARAATFSVSAEDRNRAAVFANDIASSMWTQNNVSIDAATLATWNSVIANTAQGGLRKGTVTINAVSGNSADITIQWQPASNTTTDTLLTRVTLP